MASSECKIKKVLIANRGEIAVRIIRSLKSMGIESHAVYSDSDRESLHVKSADYAHHLGAEGKKLSYLDIDKIIQIARKNKIDAVHPGYGFLSENSGFAKRLKDSGIIFIGPDHKSMELLGDKVQAKKLAEKLKVPTLKVQKVSSSSPFPLLVKAAGGGGGRGMRIVRKFSDLDSALESAKREAKSAFDNDTVFIERYLSDVRHIEVQIAADKYGDVRHLFDRDCTMQRNHQKIIEEAPALNIPDKTRNNMYAAAIKLCKAAKYSNLATVEFLLDKSGNFFFLEVNTRLQVEHTVSEEITGLDFVKLQIELAEGKKLKKLLPEKFANSGHAIQCRICAESPENNFIPSSGRISKFGIPAGINIRIDSGFEKGSIIGHQYDSLVAKLIITGKSRADAIAGMQAALKSLELHGIVSNIAFLSLLVSSQEFSAFKIHTRYIASFLSEIDWGKAYTAEAAHFLFRALEMSPENGDIWNSKTGWRMDGSKSEISRTFTINRGVQIEASISVVDRNSFVNTEDQKIFELDYRRPTKSAPWFQSSLGSICVEENPYLSKVKEAAAANNSEIKSSLPGKVIKLNVKAGQEVSAEQELIVIESMKMEHILRAGNKGKIKAVNVKPGDFVTPGTVMIEFES